MPLSTRLPALVTRCVVAGALLAGVGGVAAAPATAAPAAPVTVAAVEPVITDEPTDPVENYVYWVYQDLLGRDVDPVGLAGWSTALRNGVPRVAVVNGITYSDEFRIGLITEAYHGILGRDVDPVGAATWLAAMRGGLTIQELEASILASQEYVGTKPTVAWVEALYLDVLGRPASNFEASGWAVRTMDLPRRPRLTYTQVALGILNSTEALTPRVDAYYEVLLGRSIDPTGARDWVAAIQAGARLEQIVGGIIASDEYFNL